MPRLTGKKRFRIDKKGKLILQLQETYLSITLNNMVFDWKDAKVKDITVNCKETR